ncbi:hypothetical protein P9Y11_22975 [Bacillus cereus]|nr:hypothetical protein [Bacillus cereus]
MAKKEITLKLDWKQQLALTGALLSCMAGDDVEIFDEDKFDHEAWHDAAIQDQIDRLGDEMSQEKSDQDVTNTVNDLFRMVAGEFIKEEK